MSKLIVEHGMSRNRDTYPTGIGARMPTEMRRRAEALAVERGWNLGDVLREALARYLETTTAAAEEKEGGAAVTTLDGRATWRGRGT